MITEELKRSIEEIPDNGWIHEQNLEAFISLAEDLILMGVTEKNILKHLTHVFSAVSMEIY
jgi:hypothetical protein